MNFWSLFFSVILLFWITFCSYLFTCKYLEFCEVPMIIAQEDSVDTNTQQQDETISPSDKKPEGLIVFYDNKPLIQADDNYAFEKAGMLKFTPELDVLHDSLQRFLKAYPDKQLKITGQYLNEEENTTKFDNLGLARADQIAQLMIKGGVKPSQVLTFIETKGDFPKLGSSYYGGVLLEVQDRPKENVAKEEDTKEGQKPLVFSQEEKKLIFAQQNVYFDLASSYATINEAYIQLVIKYLKANPKVKVSIIGHTDTLGNKAKNMALSRDRAENVKKQLVEKGVDSARLITKGEGQEKPVADNTTEAGRSRNRRVEILIQKQK